MPFIQKLSTVLLLAATSLAAPFPNGINNIVVARDGLAPCSPLPCTANGILYAMMTITLPYGSVSTPTAPSSDSLAAPVVTSPSTANPQAPTSVSTATGTPGPALPQASSSAPATSAAATPTPAKNEAPSTGSLTPATILKVMPLSGSCVGRDSQKGSCRTADQAAAPLAKGFDTWKITSKGAQAANLALIAYESGQMMYKLSATNPPIPGKGTYAVMMPPNVKLYATQLKGEAAVAQAGTVEKILDLVNASDDDAFGAASWYMSTQCPGAQEKFNGDVDAAWTYYISQCVNGGDMAGRQPFWDSAKQAFGL